MFSKCHQSLTKPKSTIKHFIILNQTLNKNGKLSEFLLDLSGHFKGTKYTDFIPALLC